MSSWREVRAGEVAYEWGDQEAGIVCICGRGHVFVSTEDEHPCDECGRVYRAVWRLDVNEASLPEEPRP